MSHFDQVFQKLVMLMAVVAFSFFCAGLWMGSMLPHTPNGFMQDKHGNIVPCTETH